jgi:hypothetical protein
MCSVPPSLGVSRHLSADREQTVFSDVPTPEGHPMDLPPKQVTGREWHIQSLHVNYRCVCVCVRCACVRVCVWDAGEPC